MRQRVAGLATGKMPMPKPTLRQRLALLWRWLNQPLPGTSPRQTKPVVRVEGRIPGKTLSVLTVLLLAGMLADMAGWWQVSSFDPFQLYFAWVSSLVCNAGWGGYSQGLWGIAGGIILFGFLPAWLLWASAVRQACPLMHRRTHLPPAASRGFPWRCSQAGPLCGAGGVCCWPWAWRYACCCGRPTCFMRGCQNCCCRLPH